jgi:outer membrane receptor for ferrienterochelin and colicins
MKRTALTHLLSGIVSLSALSAPASAQSSSELDALLGQAIVSTPSKGAETDTTAPATSTVISADELRRYGIRSLDEAIDYLSLGMATSTPGHTAEVAARGVRITGDYGNHVLLLLDGHTVNEPWNGTAYFERGAGIPFEMIDHIEVMLGPGSVMYGSQAMLGVINVVTKRAKNFSGARLVVEGDAALPGGADASLSRLGTGYRLGGAYGREFSLANSPSELTLGLEYYRNHGPEWQVGPQQFTEDYITLAPKNFGPKAAPGVWGGRIREADYIDVPAGYLRFSTGDFRAQVHASSFRRSTPYPESLSAYTADFDDPHNREIDRFLSLDLSQRLAVSSRVELVVRGYADLYDYQWFNRTSSVEDCPADVLNGCDRKLDGRGRILGGELRTSLQWPVLRASTLFGVDAKLRDVKDRLVTFDGSGRQVDGPIGSSLTDGIVAAYAAQAFSPTNFLDVNLGLRLDHDTRAGDSLSPRLALGATPWSGGRWKLIYAEAFRAPSSYEVTYTDPSSQVAAPDLVPETVRSLEASMEQRFGKHRILFGLFRSWWSDMVGTANLTEAEIEAGIGSGELAPGIGEAYRRRNIARIDNYGFNAAYDGAAMDGRLRFGLNYTAARTTEDPGDGTGTHTQPVSPQAFGNARISYDLSGSLPTLGVAVRFNDRQLIDRFYDGGFTAPATAAAALALKFTVSGRMPALEKLSYRLGAEYSFARNEPYAIGPMLYALDESSRTELAPVRRAQVFLGLEYAFEATAVNPY